MKKRSLLPWRSSSAKNSSHHHHHHHHHSADSSNGLEQRRTSSVKSAPSHEQPWKTIVASATAQFEKNWTSPKQSTARLDDFKLMRTLGVGSFARVIQGRHHADCNYYAIKVLNKAKIVSKHQVKQVLREKKVLQSASFPFIASLAYSFKDNTNLYMVLEYVNGGELFSFMRRSGKLSEDSSRFYVAQLVLVFEYLHNVDVLYRDLKPENLLVDSDGYLKLVDFGFAKRTRSRTYTVCGTPDYLAPEIIQSKGYGKSVDWWALGVLLYEMTAGYPPFHCEHESQTYERILAGKFTCADDTSTELAQLLHGLLETDLTRRLGCMRAGITDIKHHVWFTNTHWLDIYHKQVLAPFKPACVNGPSDSSNFAQFSDEDIVVGSTDTYAELFSEF